MLVVKGAVRLPIWPERFPYIARCLIQPLVKNGSIYYSFWHQQIVAGNNDLSSRTEEQASAGRDVALWKS
jgi:hypothetical protein